MFALMIKKHKKTGLMYLCQTARSDYLVYLGSGMYWKRHLKKHGKDVDTQVLGLFETKEELRKAGREASEFYDVVNSSEWANMRPEDGDGGDTVSRQMWITDGVNECYIPRQDEVPVGWRKGRADSCKFKNREFQSDLSSRVDRKKAGLGIKKAWADGRMKNRKPRQKGIRLSESTKQKIRIAAIGRRHTPEAKQRMSITRKGHFVSLETRAKMAAASKGRRHSEETKQKLRLSAIKRGQKREAIVTD